MTATKTVLLVATTNQKKLYELQVLLKDFPLELKSLKDFSNIKEVPETGKTFEDNAALKANGYAEQTGCLTLAEDSGLCCDALEGAPGVYSARFAGESKTDKENTAKVLKLLKDMPDNCRGAHFKSAAALADQDELIGTVAGEVHGYISREVKGSNGFGYDPIFYYPPYEKCFGEVTSEMKHKVSHRSKALQKIRALLVKYLKERQ